MPAADGVGEAGDAGEAQVGGVGAGGDGLVPGHVGKEAVPPWLPQNWPEETGLGNALHAGDLTIRAPSCVGHGKGVRPSGIIYCAAVPELEVVGEAHSARARAASAIRLNRSSMESRSTVRLSSRVS